MLNVHGHGLAVRMLEAGLKSDRLHHAYLLSGPAHVGKTTLATQLAQAVNCTADDRPCGTCGPCTRVASGAHADVSVIEVDPDATEGARTVISIDAVKDLIASAHLRPFEGRTRVYVIQGADRLSHDAANALLKVLEEPPPDVLLLLLTDNADGVLPTIRSRCQLIEMRPLPVARVAEVLRGEHGASEEQAEMLARLSRGCLGWAIEASTDPAALAAVQQRLERIADVIDGELEARFAYADELARRFARDRAAGREELFLWMRWLRDVLLIQQGQGDRIVNLSWRDTLERQAAAITSAELTRWLHALTDTVGALDRNANPRLALEALMLSAPQGTALHPLASAERRSPA